MARYGEGVTPPKDLLPYGFPIKKQIPDSLFKEFMGKWRVHHMAHDQFTAFVKAAKAELGVNLIPIPGSSSAYRSYTAQKNLFLSRYRKGGGGKQKTWNGVRYGLKRGMAMAATPGYSIHGLGLAIDFSNDGQYIGNSLRKKLRPIAARFRIVDSVRSENWHWVCQDAAMQVDGYKPTHNQAPSGAEFVNKFGAYPNLEKGSDGLHVAMVQRIALASNQDVGPVDGKYGSKTAAGVVNLQKYFKLSPADGKVTDNEWALFAKLDEVFSKPGGVYEQKGI